MNINVCKKILNSSEFYKKIPKNFFFNNFFFNTFLVFLCALTDKISYSFKSLNNVLASLLIPSLSANNSLKCRILQSKYFSLYKKNNFFFFFKRDRMLRFSATISMNKAFFSILLVFKN